MREISTRLAGAGDAEAVAGLVHALLDELSGGKAPAPKAVLDTARAVLAEESVVAVIAETEGAPVGVMVLNACMAIYAGGRFGEISELYVRPELRSRGVAPKLLEVALAEGRARGWKRLEVGAPGQPAWKRTLDFYVRNGFQEVGPRLRRLL